MIGRLRLALTSFLAVGLTALLFVPVAEAQEASGRFRVVVPRLQPTDDSDDDFGDDVGDSLRDLLNNMATHQPVEEDEIEDALDQFDMDWEDLNCVRTVQLAGQIDSQVALCGGYEEVSDGQYQVDTRFVVVRNNESFSVDPITVGEDDYDEAAQHIIDAFDRVVQQTRAAAFCQDYFNSQQWESALENCNRAIELNPESVSAHYTKARTLEKMDRLEDALAEFQTVLEMDPVHENALQWAGNVSARLDRNDQARDYYSQYLELNPEDASVRMRIAYDLAQAGDPVGAMQLIEEGLELTPDNADLWEQYGNFAFTGASQAMEEEGLAAQVREASEGQADEVPAQVQEYYRTAIDAYERVFEMKGDSTDPSQLRNVVAAHIQLGENQQAIDFAQRALDAHPESARLWSIYADALNRNDQVDQAIAALDSVQQIDPDYANVAVRQGSWLLQAGRVEDALPKLQTAVERGEQSADVVARLVLSDAHSNGVQQENYGYAIEGIEVAKAFDVSAGVQAQLNFWHAYSLYQQAVQQQEPQTVESAEATLPKFQQALELFRASEDYASQQSSINLQKFLDAAQTYIEIQEAIIERASR